METSRADEFEFQDERTDFENDDPCHRLGGKDLEVIDDPATDTDAFFFTIHDVKPSGYKVPKGAAKVTDSTSIVIVHMQVLRHDVMKDTVETPLEDCQGKATQQLLMLQSSTFTMPELYALLAWDIDASPKYSFRVDVPEKMQVAADTLAEALIKVHASKEPLCACARVPKNEHCGGKKNFQVQTPPRPGSACRLP